MPSGGELVLLALGTLLILISSAFIFSSCCILSGYFFRPFFFFCSLLDLYIRNSRFQVAFIEQTARYWVCSTKAGVEGGCHNPYIFSYKRRRKRDYKSEEVSDFASAVTFMKLSLEHWLTFWGPRRDEDTDKENVKRASWAISCKVRDALQRCVVVACKVSPLQWRSLYGDMALLKLLLCWEATRNLPAAALEPQEINCVLLYLVCVCFARCICTARCLGIGTHFPTALGTCCSLASLPDLSDPFSSLPGLIQHGSSAPTHFPPGAVEHLLIFFASLYSAVSKLIHTFSCPYF